MSGKIKPLIIKILYYNYLCSLVKIGTDLATSEFSLDSSASFNSNKPSISHQLTRPVFHPKIPLPLNFHIGQKSLQRTDTVLLLESSYSSVQLNFLIQQSLTGMCISNIHRSQDVKEIIKSLEDEMDYL